MFLFKQKERELNYENYNNIYITICFYLNNVVRENTVIEAIFTLQYVSI